AFKAECDLQVRSEDGSWHSIKRFTFDRSNPSVQVGPMVQGAVVEAFSAQTSCRFRVLFRDIKGKAGLAEIHLSAAARVERYIEKQLGKMFPTPQPLWDAYLWPQPQEPEAEELIVSPDQVKDISRCLQADGVLTWDVPEGEWIVLRTGMAPTGVKNAPASPEATGLEVDKMNHQAVEYHFNAYIGELLERLPPDQRQALKHIVADSYEMGSQNWTDGFRQAFVQRYGYDPVMWLPVLSGRIIASAEQSDRFLWDMRRLVADRVAQEYVGGLAEVAHAHKLKLWLENYGHWGFPGEFLQYGAGADHLSGEFWATGDLGSIELRAASSASHIYGMPVVSAEAFTGGPAFVSHPYALKKRGDEAYAEGINHFVLHVYIHQPWENRKPGMNAWFGTEFNRHNTWFAQSKSWIDYLRRCHFLLQQGNPVADIAYLIGEDTPKMTGVRHPALPSGYDYDYINSDAILHRLQVKDHRFVLPNGTSYAVLVLPDRDAMRPELLKKIVELTAAGGTVLGAPPSRSPSMRGYPGCDQAVQELAAGLWESCDGETQRMAVFQQGRVYRNIGLDSLLRDLGFTADFSAPQAPEVLYTHKRSGDVDIYFLTNQSERSLAIAPLFRVHGKQPELWNPVTGETIVTARFIQQADGTCVRLQLEPWGSLFVVFQKKSAKDPTVIKTLFNGEEADLPVRILKNGKVQLEVQRPGSYQLLFSGGQKRTLDSILVPSPLPLKGPWQVRFIDGGASLQSILFDSLFSWTDHPDANIEYYSGTAVYEKIFDWPSGSEQEGRMTLLDLGDVGVMAQVAVNGHPVAELWKPPFVVDIGPYLQTGSNHLCIS
ncbi:glycoside hydrolase family 2, partial [bacterium]|nr:glycoside hydrolase family 2 [bacterium]